MLTSNQQRSNCQDDYRAGHIPPPIPQYRCLRYQRAPSTWMLLRLVHSTAGLAWCWLLACCCLLTGHAALASPTAKRCQSTLEC
jgi:hypothetical protein